MSYSEALAFTKALAVLKVRRVQPCYRRLGLELLFLDNH